jgi:hypothetical protein
MIKQIQEKAKIWVTQKTIKRKKIQW